MAGTLVELPATKRALALLGPLLVGIFLFAVSPLYSEEPWRLTRLHWAAFMVAFFVSLPSLVVITFLRMRTSFVGAVSALVVLTAYAVIATERSDLSTKGLIMLYIPFIGIPVTMIIVLLDRIARRTQHGRSN